MLTKIQLLIEVSLHRLEFSRLTAQRALYEKETYKQSEPLISIIVPTFNRSLMLVERSIPSILKQDYSNFEIIVVGDGCTDSTESVIRKFRDTRLKFFNLHPRPKRPSDLHVQWLIGPTFAMNRGFMEARGKWIAKLDDDDEWTEGSLSTRIKYALSNKIEFLTGSSIVEEFGVEKLSLDREVTSTYYAPKRGLYYPKKLRIPGHRVGSLSTLLIPAYLKFLKFYPKSYLKPWNKVNDIDFIVRSYNAGVRMAYLDEILAIRRPRPGFSELGSCVAASDQNTYGS